MTIAECLKLIQIDCIVTFRVGGRKLETLSFSVDYFVKEKVKYCFVMQAINY